MALIRCNDCNQQISEYAESCPFCGCPTNASMVKNGSKYLQWAKRNKQWLLIIVGLIILTIVMINELGDSTNERHNYDYDYDYDYGSNYSMNQTTGNQGALNKAKDYLRSQAFSYRGLINQLEYHGYSESEAKYGADYCGANWNDQALKKAKNYLSSQAFSQSGLKKQLEYEGFTESEASYAVERCGANWKEQAKKKAASYNRSSNFTRTQMIKQLEYEGFTHDQAVYGASQNGL